MTRRKSPRQKSPEIASDVAAYVKEEGGFHLHRFRYAYGYSWKLALKKTKKTCGSDQCFVMRLKNVREAGDTNAPLARGE